ncbi:MAG: hypothetical protein BGO14_10330 [Chlamydiales bacterium 38-26]|nr:hypothetical protein [Chlamydiales bacterium]OJV11356.1 MAG: hypothetical protein BGO14_10330 [Chlamydiales bacterium 38-26]
MVCIKASIRFITFLLIFITTLHADIVRRAALDLGSSETKLTIADVDTETHKIVKIYYQDYRTVELRKDLATSPDGTLSKEIEEKIIEVLDEYKNMTLKFAPEQWFGVGTSVFRSAINGAEFLERVKEKTGIPLYLASQMEEGEIGFQSAVAASGLDAEEIIAWDSGSGSFQMTTINNAHMDMYGAEFAFVSTLEILIQRIRKEKFNPNQTPNPISKDEIELLISIIQKEYLPPIPYWLSHTNKKIICFGGYTSIFSMGQIATAKETYKQKDLFHAIQNLIDKSDDQLTFFPEPHKAVVGLALLYSVMNHCEIDEMIYKKTNGGCEGLLIIPRYWD